MTEKKSPTKRVRKRPSTKLEVPNIRPTEPTVKTKLDRLDTSPAIVSISNTPKLAPKLEELASRTAPILISLGLRDLQAIASHVGSIQSLSYDGTTWTVTSKSDPSNVCAVGKSDHSPKLAIADMIIDAREKGIML